MYRLINKEELWPNTGNKESIKALFSNNLIVLFMLKSYFFNKKKMNRYINKYRDIKFIKLRSPKEVNKFLNNIK